MQYNALNIKTTAKQVWSYFRQNYVAGIRGYYHEPSDCFQYPRKSLLYKSPIKLCHRKILAIFSYLKISRNRKFQTQKNPSIIPVT